MRRILVVLLIAAFTCSMAFAADQPTTPKADQTKATKTESAKKASGTMKSEHLNNVIKMDAQANRTALCMCGKEFQVTDQSPTVKHGEETDYCCSQGCHDMYMSASKDAQHKMVSEYWKTKFPFDKMATNTYVKDGKKMATCLCGKTVEVNDKTPHVTENGVTMYLCSDACTTALHGMAAKDRMDKELAMLTGTKTEEKKVEAPGTPK